MLCKKILDKLPKPSDFVDNMVAGLRRDDLNIEINMSSFGFVEQIDGKETCFGCAATRALYNLFGKTASSDDIANCLVKLNIFGLSHYEMTKFENIVDILRKGIAGHSPTELYTIEYGYRLKSGTLPAPKVPLELLSSDFTESQLEAYEMYAEQLREAGY